MLDEVLDRPKEEDFDELEVKFRSTVDKKSTTLATKPLEEESEDLNIGKLNFYKN